MSLVMRTDDLVVTTGMWNLIHHIQIISFFAWNNRNLDDFGNLSLQLHIHTLCLYFLPPPTFMINNLCAPPRSRWAIWPKNVNNYSEDKIMKHNITTILLAGSRTGCPHISHYRRTTYSWVTNNWVTARYDVQPSVSIDGTAVHDLPDTMSFSFRTL